MKTKYSDMYHQWRSIEEQELERQALEHKKQAEQMAKLQKYAQALAPWGGRDAQRFNPHTGETTVETITTIDGFEIQCYEAPWKSGLRVYGINNTPPLGAKVFLPFDWRQKNPLREYVAPETIARMKEYVESYENLVS